MASPSFGQCEDPHNAASEHPRYPHDMRPLGLPLLVLIGCQARPTGDAPLDSVTDSGARDSADTADTAPPFEGVALPNDCAAPPDVPEDAFVLLGSVNNTQRDGGWFHEIVDVEWVDPYLLTVGQGGLVLYDVSEPDAVQTISHYAPEDLGFARYYHLEAGTQSLVYATHRDHGVEVLSIVDPLAPGSVLKLSLPGAEGLDREGDTLFVATLEGEVVAYDLTNPAEPVELGRYRGSGRYWDVLVADGTLYVADGEGEVEILDRASLTLLGILDSSGTPARLAREDNRLVVAAGGGGVEVWDITDTAAPTLALTLDGGGGAADVAISEGRIWATTQEAVVAWEADGTPIVFQETEQFAMAIAARGDSVAVGDWNILGSWALGATPAPALDLDTTTLSFFDGAAVSEATITNRGGAPLTLSGLQFAGAGYSALVSTATLEPGATAILQVTSDGSATAATTLCIASDDPSGSKTLTLNVAGEGEGKAIGQTAPDFALVGIDGQTYRLSEQLGYPVVLAYFASW